MCRARTSCWNLASGKTRLALLPSLARELVQLKPDAIVVIGTLAIQAGKNATTTIPLVFITNVDPVAAGLVPSLSRPGGNITGVLIAPEGTLAGKKLELLNELVPQAKRIAVLIPDDPGIGMRLQVQEAQKAAASLGIELVVVEVRRGDYAKAFAAISATHSTALFVGAHSRFLRDRNKIIELAAIHRLPAIYEWPQQVKDGGLMSYGASDTETYRRVAIYVDRIFKGTMPGELPIEQPSKLQLRNQSRRRKDDGANDPAIPAAARGRGDSVMDRRTFIGSVAGGLLVVPLSAAAQQSGKVPVVGVLNIAVGPRSLDRRYHATGTARPRLR